eukprot:PhM_4_TR15447/c0_g1_i1/m.53040
MSSLHPFGYDDDDDDSVPCAQEETPLHATIKQSPTLTNQPAPEAAAVAPSSAAPAAGSGLTPPRVSPRFNNNNSMCSTNSSFTAKDTHPHTLVGQFVVVENYHDDVVPSEDVTATDWSLQYRYGFPCVMCRDAASTEAMWWMHYKRHIDTATAEWERLLSRLESYPPSPKSSRCGLTLGVPPGLRPIIWPQFSGLREKAMENDAYVATVLEFQSNSFNRDGHPIVDVRHTATGDTHFEAIEKDLHRTFPDHPLFRDGHGTGVARVRSVLRALVWRNPVVGYCQSFNYLAALLTIVLREEDLVFWHLAHLVEDVLPNDYFSQNLMGVKVDQEVIMELVGEMSPRLALHFAEHRIDLRALIPGWVMTLFVTLFPIETTLRVWDALFLDPDAVTIPIRVVLAVFKIFADDLLHADCSSEIMMRLNQEASRLFDAGKLMKVTSSIKLSTTHLRRLRYKHRMAFLRPAYSPSNSPPPQQSLSVEPQQLPTASNNSTNNSAHPHQQRREITPELTYRTMRYSFITPGDGNEMKEMEETGGAGEMAHHVDPNFTDSKHEDILSLPTHVSLVSSPNENEIVDQEGEEAAPTTACSTTTTTNVPTTATATPLYRKQPETVLGSFLGGTETLLRKALAELNE